MFWDFISTASPVQLAALAAVILPGLYVLRSRLGL
jgi:hypothetical protein